MKVKTDDVHDYNGVSNVPRIQMESLKSEGDAKSVPINFKEVPLNFPMSEFASVVFFEVFV